MDDTANAGVKLFHEESHLNKREGNNITLGWDAQDDKELSDGLESQESIEAESEKDSLEPDEEKDQDLGDAENQLSAWEALQISKLELAALNAGGDKSGIAPEAASRKWITTLAIQALTNITDHAYDFFIVVRFGHVNRERKSLTGGLKTCIAYSDLYHLKPAEHKSFAVPLSIWTNKEFNLAYKELKSFSIEIQMWEVSNLAFNTFKCSQELTLEDILNREVRDVIELQSFATKAESGGKSVLSLSVIQPMEEVFDIDCVLCYWNVFVTDHFKDLTAASDSIQMLFDYPATPTERKQQWLPLPASSETSTGTINFTFTGSSAAFQHNYLVIRLHHGKLPPRLFQKLVQPKTIATAYISLRSTDLMSDLNGLLKRCSSDASSVIVGRVGGKLYVTKRNEAAKSWFAQGTGDNKIKYVQLEQPIGPGWQVPYLHMWNRYLIVRVFSVLRLTPSSSSSTALPDPVIEVSWDGTVHRSARVRETINPVYNEIFHFPVRLVDPEAEVTVKNLIKYTLPIDIVTKGPITVKVWHVDDDKNQELLAEADIPLHLFNSDSCKIAPRCIMENLDMAAQTTKQSRPGFKPEKFLRQDLAGDPSDEGGGGGMGGRAAYNEDAGPQAREGKKKPNNVPWYLRKDLTRVYTNEAYPICLSQEADHEFDFHDPDADSQTEKRQKATMSASMSFEMFFVPAMPQALVIPKLAHERSNLFYQQLCRRWDRDWLMWSTAYREWYPRALDKRKWPALAKYKDQFRPLCAFVTPSPLPDGIAGSGDLMHWIACLTFTHEPISTWHTPNYTLNNQKGSVQDHAVVLCSFLLGMGYDAYVAIGTLKGGVRPLAENHAASTNNAAPKPVRHYWVVTRDMNHFVTHWDPVLLEVYPAKLRYGISHRMPPSFNDTEDTQALEMPVEETQTSHPYYTGMTLIDEYNDWAVTQGLSQAEYPFARHDYIDRDENDEGGALSEDDEDSNQEDPFDQLYRDAGRRGLRKLLGLTTAYNNNTLAPPQQARRQAAKKANACVIPVPELCEEALIAWLPYATIEVCFSATGLYGNCQNADPSVIYYDFESPFQWRALLPENEAVEPIESEILISPAASREQCDRVQDSLEGDVIELVHMARSDKGLITTFEGSDHPLMLHLSRYLDLAEFMSRLDRRADPGLTKHTDTHFEEEPMDSSRYTLSTDVAGSQRPAGSGIVFARSNEQVATPTPDFGVIFSNTLRSTHVSPDSKTVAVVATPPILGRPKAVLCGTRGGPVREVLDASLAPSSLELTELDELTKRTELPVATEFSPKATNLTELKKLTRLKMVQDPIRRNRELTLHRIQLPRVSAEKEKGVRVETTAVHGSMRPILKYESDDEEGDAIDEEEALGEADRGATEQWWAAQEEQGEEDLEELEGEEEEDDAGVEYAAPGGEDYSELPEEMGGGNEDGYYTDAEEEDGDLAPKVNLKPLPPYHFRYEFSHDPIDKRHYAAELVKWQQGHELMRNYRRWRKHNFSVKENYSFCGAPLHLAGSEVARFRSRLLRSETLSPLLALTSGSAIYVVKARVFPLVGNVLSCWVFIGVYLPWAKPQLTSGKRQELQREGGVTG